MTTVGELGIGLELMSRYVSPVNPAVYPHLTLVLLGIGLFFMAWFFVYEQFSWVLESCSCYSGLAFMFNRRFALSKKQMLLKQDLLCGLFCSFITT
ncbi:hypothetical protein TNIN_378141 [Trichonephila inaurata madagascariensis]|uniref:Dolichyl-diphosphooligosaccharide-protein glycosyltransferase subunit TMEM258 n=1 Tax=Trichonephila inaurata madagascariensis TaxID=2747483 RepID=A0A8X6WUZ1_9ARAC|nr:hypothetical protein TNIN_378141 [Trichonephila inaurata madagascariensis]